MEQIEPPRIPRVGIEDMKSGRCSAVIIDSKQISKTMKNGRPLIYWVLTLELAPGKIREVVYSQLNGSYAFLYNATIGLGKPSIGAQIDLRMVESGLDGKQYAEITAVLGHSSPVREP